MQRVQERTARIDEIHNQLIRSFPLALYLDDHADVYSFQEFLEFVTHFNDTRLNVFIRVKKSDCWLLAFYIYLRILVENILTLFSIQTYLPVAYVLFDAVERKRK